MTRMNLPFFVGWFIWITASSYHLGAQEPDARKQADMLIVVISGFDSDPTPAQIEKKAFRGSGNSGMYQLVSDLDAKGFRTKFFNWNGTSAGEFTHKNAPGTEGIVSYIRDELKKNEADRLALIGHSWGGHTMLEVAQKLELEPRIDIHLAFGVDPSSLSRGKRPEELPKSIQSCVIYYTRNAFVWGAWKECDRVENIDLGDTSNGFKPVNGGNYAALFDVNAHNAAEWDEGIHKDIMRRLEAASSTPSVAPRE